MLAPSIVIPRFALYCGDTCRVLRPFPSNYFDMCVTSPPYYCQRDNRTAIWSVINGCDHLTDEPIRNDLEEDVLNLPEGSHIELEYWPYIGKCGRCGATSTDEQIGIEETPDEYIANLVEVFNEVSRVLRDDGTLWVNIGDSYAGRRSRCTKRFGTKSYNVGRRSRDATIIPAKTVTANLKPKNMIGIPWLLAFALRDKVGLYLRSEIIWKKETHTPESVKDRPTKSQEKIFLFSKSPDYYYDADAIAEPAKDGGTRNARDVWTFAPAHGKYAHYSAFPEYLPEQCIKAGCPEDGIVLDCFSGIGTTLVVAGKLGRSAVGIELSGTYCEMAEQRCASEGMQVETRRVQPERQRQHVMCDWKYYDLSQLNAEQLQKVAKAAQQYRELTAQTNHERSVKAGSTKRKLFVVGGLVDQPTNSVDKPVDNSVDSVDNLVDKPTNSVDGPRRRNREIIADLEGIPVHVLKEMLRLDPATIDGFATRTLTLKEAKAHKPIPAGPRAPVRNYGQLRFDPATRAPEKKPKPAVAPVCQEPANRREVMTALGLGRRNYVDLDSRQQSTVDKLVEADLEHTRIVELEKRKKE